MCSDSQVLGRFVPVQKTAVETLQDNENRLTHDELQAELCVGREVMQAVLRGLKDNGVVRVKTRETGQRVYSLRNDVNVTRIY